MMVASAPLTGFGLPLEPLLSSAASPRRAPPFSRRTDERPDGRLGQMFAYYDAHGLPVGTFTLAALLGRVGSAR